MFISLALHSEQQEDEAWPTSHVVQQSWQEQTSGLAVTKLETDGSLASTL